MIAIGTILFGDSITAPKDTYIAKAIGVSPATVGRWKRDPDKMPFGKVVKQAKLMGYTVKFVRNEREYEA